MGNPSAKPIGSLDDFCSDLEAMADADEPRAGHCRRTFYGRAHRGAPRRARTSSGGSPSHAVRQPCTGQRRPCAGHGPVRRLPHPLPMDHPFLDDWYACRRPVPRRSSSRSAPPAWQCGPRIGGPASAYYKGWTCRRKPDTWRPRPSSSAGWMTPFRKPSDCPRIDLAERDQAKLGRGSQSASGRCRRGGKQSHAVRAGRATDHGTSKPPLVSVMTAPPGADEDRWSGTGKGSGMKMSPKPMTMRND